LKGVIEGGNAGKSYVDALTNVLEHELARRDKEPSQTSSVSRGGLATWQIRTVAQHIEEHLSKQISLAALASLARLSQSHFSRAFKKSFGVPPHEYQFSDASIKPKLYRLSARRRSPTSASPWATPIRVRSASLSASLPADRPASFVEISRDLGIFCQ
jgi:AraC-like DNA-binding protein